MSAKPEMKSLLSEVDARRRTLGVNVLRNAGGFTTQPFAGPASHLDGILVDIPKANIHWLQFHDGMLEYANPLDLVEEVTGIIRKFRPDVVMSIDPGSEYVRWHKTDHRMAANNTIDAIRASEWHLYFPNQLLHDHLEPWKVPHEVYFYVTPQDANYFVNIDAVEDLKLDAAVAHVSQGEPSSTTTAPTGIATLW